MKKSNRITIDDIRKNPILIDKVESGEVDLRTFTKDDLVNLYKSNKLLILIVNRYDEIPPFSDYFSNQEY